MSFHFLFSACNNVRNDVYFLNLQLQMPNLRQASGPASQTPFQDSQVGQLPAVQPHSSLPPLAQSNVLFGLMPKVQKGQVSTVPQTSVRNQLSTPTQLPIQTRVQLPQHANEHALQQAMLPGQSLVSPFPLQPHSSSSLSLRPQIQVTSSPLNLQMQPPSLKNPGQVGTSNLGHSIQMVQSNATIQPPLLARHSLPDAGYQVPFFPTGSCCYIHTNKKTKNST